MGNRAGRGAATHNNKQSCDFHVKYAAHFAFALVCECVCVWHLAALQGKINPLALINLPSAILIKKQYRNTTILQLMYYLLFLSIKKNTDIPHLHKKKTKQKQILYANERSGNSRFQNLLPASVRFYSLPTAVQKNT